MKIKKFSFIESMDSALHIIPAVKRGLNDELAFEKVYRQYFIRLFRFCFSIVHQKEAAEEIVNDVFLYLWKRREQSGDIRNLGVYLYIATKNLSLNYLRDNHFLHVVDISEQVSQYIKLEVTPGSLMESAETIRQMQNAIDELPPRCRLIFKLIKEDGLKYKDVAALLNISVKTVEAQLAIAMKKIAVLLIPLT
ncbi:MAG TPA: RNA polymerase sigma-70 factor [Puia sp.]|nr:RNA polymerase sigma-70 factor [Puia sp.]